MLRCAPMTILSRTLEHPSIAVLDVFECCRQARNICKRTCNMCADTTLCVDNSRACERRARGRSGERFCSRLSNQQLCPRSCGKCIDVSQGAFHLSSVSITSCMYIATRVSMLWSYTTTHMIIICAHLTMLCNRWVECAVTRKIYTCRYLSVLV